MVLLVDSAMVEQDSLVQDQDIMEELEAVAAGMVAVADWVTIGATVEHRIFLDMRDVWL